METIIKSENLAEVQVRYKSKVKPSDRPKITKSQDAYEILKTVWDENKIEHLEEFVILLLNKAAKVLGWCKISVGGVGGTVVDAKIVFQVAINSNATSIILAHNHPSGNIKPSDQDIRLTKRIKQGGELLEIAIMDHIIITTEGYYSFADEGQM